MLIADIIDSYIKKSGFDPDQPRDERGRWTDSANSNVAEDKHKQITDSLYKMSTDEINTHVRKGNPTIDLILHSWQQSSESVGANVLKEMVVKVEGLHDFKTRPNKDAIRRVIDSNYLTSPIVASCFGIKTVEVLDYKQDNIEAGLSYTTVPMTIEGLQKAIKKDPHVAGSIGKAVKDAVFEKIKKSTDPQGAFKKLIDHPMLNKYFSAYSSFNETHYHELRAAGQVMMEKQGYPNKLTLYRGLAVPLTKEVCLNIGKSVASGDRNYTLKIPADPISSYTTLHKVAEDFAENTAKSINEVGIVIHAPTKREDILIPSKLIQFNEGKEKEHIVINRGHIQNVKLKNTIPPEFSKLKSVMRYSVSNNKEDPYYRKLLSMESEYTLNREAIIKEVLSKDRRDKPYQYDSPYADTLAKAGFNEDQPRDEKGMWTDSGAGEKIDRGATARDRSSGFASPVKAAIDRGIINKNTTVFDLGCGKGQDVDRLNKMGVSAKGYDPFHAPDNPKVKADIVMTNFVLNVIEDPDERKSLLREAYSLANKGILISARVDRSSLKQLKNPKPYRDGYLVGKNSFQKFYTTGELKEFIDTTLKVNSKKLLKDTFYVEKDIKKSDVERIVDYYLTKAGFDPDQPRDSSGRWTDGGGSSGVPSKIEANIKRYESKFSKYTPEEITQKVRRDDKQLNILLQLWQGSSVNSSAFSLKQQVNKHEGIDVINRAHVEPIRSGLFFIKDKELATKALKEMNSVLKKYESGKSLVNEDYTDPNKTLDNICGFLRAKSMFPKSQEQGEELNTLTHEALKQPAIAKLANVGIQRDVSDNSYAKLRAAGQTMMEKEGYPEKVTLYRGSAWSTFEDGGKEAIKQLVLSVADSGKAYISSDNISSWTTLPDVAKKFASAGDFGFVQKIEVSKKDILVPASLIRYNEGKEQEHIVINRKGYDEVSSENTAFVFPTKLGLDLKDVSGATLETYKSFHAKANEFLDIESFKPTKLNLHYLKKPVSVKGETPGKIVKIEGVSALKQEIVNILKAGFNEDQPRDEKGRWTSGGGGSGKGKDTLYEYHKDQMKHLNPEQINKLVRKKNKKVNELIHDWQNSATSRGAQTLKEATRLYEGLKKASVRITPGMVLDGLKEAPADSVYKLAESLKIQLPAIEFNAYGAFKGVHWVDARDIVPKIEELKAKLDAPQEATGVQAALKEAGLDRKPVSEGFKEIVKKQITEATRIRACSEVVEHYYSLKDYVNRVSAKDAMYKESEKGIAAIEKISVSDVKNNKNLDKDFPRTTYNQLKAAGQLIMEKQNYPEKVTLLRGLTTKLTANECEKILYSVVNDKTDTDKLKIAVDVLASYTTQRDVAHNFGTSYDGDETMGLVIVRDVPRKDILVPSKLIQYNEGIEKEHIVIHKTPKVDVPLNKIILPNYRDLSGHYDMVTNSERGNLGRSEMIRDIYNEKVSKHNSEVKKYVRDKGHYRLDW